MVSDGEGGHGNKQKNVENMKQDMQALLAPCARPQVTCLEGQKMGKQ